MAYLNIQSNATSGCDTYMPMELISDETHETLISVSNKHTTCNHEDIVQLISALMKQVLARETGRPFKK